MTIITRNAELTIENAARPAGLTGDQQAAFEAFDEFMRAPDPGSWAFLLEGGAGVGKTWLVGQLLNRYEQGIRCVAAPTHKAVNVLRRKLEGFGVDWCRGYDDYSYNGEDVITGTTAQLLGLAPVVTDDQTEDEITFGKTGKGILSKVVPSLLVIDEVSMLGQHAFLDLVRFGKQRGMKILAVGDAGQLPPVKEVALPFHAFRNKATLRQIVRQAEGSAIIQVAWAIRDGEPWRGIRGPGVRAEESVVEAFLEAVAKPDERPEEQREVFIAYTNRRVDAVQEKACQKLYGHGRLAFAPGELVLAENNLYREKTLLCANQDELVVERFAAEPDPVCGVPVTLRHRRQRGTFQAFYLSPEDLANKEHPYNVELRARSERANKLQKEWKALGHGDSRKQGVDQQRRKAWVELFQWRDQTVISFRHPFSITSHKSQGSTYRSVFVDVPDIARFSSQALYVAVTRPAQELVVAS